MNVREIVWKRYVSSQGLLSVSPPPITDWISRDRFVNFARITAVQETGVVDDAIESATELLEQEGYYIRQADVVIRKSVEEFILGSGYHTNQHIDNTLAPISRVSVLEDNGNFEEEGNSSLVGNISQERTYFRSFFPYISSSATGYYNLKYRVGFPVGTAIPPLARNVLLRMFVDQYSERSGLEMKGREGMPTYMGKMGLNAILP